MDRITFYRIFKNGLLDYSRNFWLSVAATAIMIITLFMMSSLLILNSLAGVSLNALREKVDISVYFQSDVLETAIKQIQRQLEFLPEVKSVVYIPPVLARQKFIELHKDEPLVLESVEQFSEKDNPFPASFAIRVHDLSDYPKIINIFTDPKFTPFVKKITDKRNIVDRLNRITEGVKKLGLGLSVIFGLITVVVMFNTIRLTIYNRREEIEIMRLVGASNWFIRGPFVVEGIFYGIAGAVIASAILYPIVHVLTPKIARFLELDVSNFGLLGPKFWILLVLQLGLGIVLAIISSSIVIRRYLKI